MTVLRRALAVPPFATDPADLIDLGVAAEQAGFEGFFLWDHLVWSDTGEGPPILDPWQILAVDCYDRRGQLYRVQEGHVINYYEVPNLWTTLELVMDLSNGRYLALGLQTEEPRSYDFSVKRTPADYQPNALQLRGVR